MIKLICPNCNKEHHLKEYDAKYNFVCSCGQKISNIDNDFNPWISSDKGKDKSNLKIYDKMYYILLIIILISIIFKKEGGIYILIPIFIISGLVGFYNAIRFKGYKGKGKYYSKDDNPIQYYIGIISMIVIFILLIIAILNGIIRI
ncbi:MAG: hypothetical protein PHZ26_03980 [Candidatus Gracilibacteria bacterium]|nr:hypothetical protein [Candidatus Gracilibacteria bacterium]MDD2908887.1 hypothetical protein [Candidatus Gracilibacteria bacterium]